MKLAAVRIDTFKSIAKQRLPSDDLVVLFGANGAGKTNVLEALHLLLAKEDGPVRWDLAADRGHWVAEGGFALELESADIPGHRDRQILDELFLGLRGDSENCRIRRSSERFLAADASPDDMREVLIEDLAGSGPIGLNDVRRSLARMIVERSFLSVEASDTWLVVNRGAFDEAELDHLRVALVPPSEDDHLAAVAHAMLEDGYASVESLGAGWCHDAGRNYLDVAWVVTEPEGLEQLLEDRMLEIDRFLGRPGRSWSPVSDVIDPTPHLWLDVPLVTSDTPPANPDVRYTDNAGVRFSSGLADAGHPVAVRPILFHIAKRIEERANEVAPAFVSDQGRISVRVLPPSTWPMYGRHVEVCLTRGDGRSFPLAVVGKGLTRWIAASVRVAVDDLLDAAWTLEPPDASTNVATTDDDPTSPVPWTYRRAPEHPDVGWFVEDVVVPFEASRLFNDMTNVPDGGDDIAAALADGSLDARLTVELPARTSTVYLVDEPEANLHPAAARSVAGWLASLSTRCAGVYVATHHPAFLELDGRTACLVHVHADESGTTTLDPVPASTVDALDDVATDVGLSRADILQLTRLVLFVEGPHDQLVLEELVGNELREARVRVVPIHGVHNALALVDSELVGQLGIRSAMLVDNFDPQRPRTFESETMDRLQQEARAAGRRIEVVGLTKRDILEYLHVDACREVARSFPGWTVAGQEWRGEHCPVPFKQFVTDRYGLPLRRRNVRHLAARTVELHGAPGEIRRLAKELTSMASAT